MSGKKKRIDKKIVSLNTKQVHTLHYNQISDE